MVTITISSAIVVQHCADKLVSILSFLDAGHEQHTPV